MGRVFTDEKRQRRHPWYRRARGSAELGERTEREERQAEHPEFLRSRDWYKVSLWNDRDHSELSAYVITQYRRIDSTWSGDPQLDCQRLHRNLQRIM